MAEDLAAEKMNMIHSYLASQKLFAASRVFQRPLQGSVVSQVLPENASHKTDEHATSGAIEQLQRPRGQSGGIRRSSPLLEPRTSSQDHATHPPTAIHKGITKDTQDFPKYFTTVTDVGPEITKARKAGAKRPRLALEMEDPQHVARLAERRERRRARMIITRGSSQVMEKGTVPAHHDSSAPGFDDDVRIAGRHRKKRKAKMPAGMALMHVFAADNVGSKRLTMRPVDQAGVFQKGKSSTMVKMISIPKIKRGAPLFDELKFLSKKPARNEGDSTSNTPHERKKLRGRNKRPATEDTNSSSSFDSESSTSHGSPAQNSQIQAFELSHDRGSVVWDIEKGLDLPEGSIHSGTAVTSTAMIDTRHAHWFNENVHSPDEIIPPVINDPVPPIDTTSASEEVNNCVPDLVETASTLAPWHSASQIGRTSYPMKTTRMGTPCNATGPDDQITHVISPTEGMISATEPIPVFETTSSNYAAAVNNQRSLSFPQTLEAPTIRSPSPSDTLDSLQRSLLRYENEDRSALYAMPAPRPTYSAWRTPLDLDMISDLSVLEVRMARSAPDDWMDDSHVALTDSVSALGSAVELLDAFNIEEPNICHETQGCSMDAMYSQYYEDDLLPSATASEPDDNSLYRTHDLHNAYLVDNREYDGLSLDHWAPHETEAFAPQPEHEQDVEDQLLNVDFGPHRHSSEVIAIDEKNFLMEEASTTEFEVSMPFAEGKNLLRRYEILDNMSTRHNVEEKVVFGLRNHWRS